MSEDRRDLDAIDLTKIVINRGKTVDIRTYPPQNDPFYTKHAALVAEFDREEAAWAALKKKTVVEDIVKSTPASQTLTAAISTAPVHVPTPATQPPRSYFGNVVSSIFNRATFGYFSTDES